DGDGAEKLAQLLRAGAVERAIGALAEPRDLAKGVAGDGVAPLVEDEDRDAKHAELAGAMAERVWELLHGVADEDERIGLRLARRRDRVVEDALDLRAAADARDAAHRPVQVGSGGEPPARLALVEAAIENKLDVEPAERRRRFEHLALDVAG